MTAILLALALAFHPAAQQMDPEEGTRQLWNTAFRDRRPPAKTAAAPAPKKAPDPVGDTLIGVTLWLLRDSRPEDDQDTRIAQYTPVRIAAETPLTEGQKVRVSIETATSGYLYVIDREQYADGSLGPPYMIFPTLRTRGGNNEVKAGRLIEIPSQQDNPRYFTIRMSRPDQVAEVLTVLVTPKPLPEVQVGRDPILLTVQQLQAWEKKWGAKVQRLEARRQIGQAYTKAEKEAAALGTRLLTHDEPLPQTMYRVDAQPGDPLLVKVPLRIAR